MKEAHNRMYAKEYAWLIKHFKWADDVTSFSSMPTCFAETVELLREYKKGD